MRETGCAPDGHLVSGAVDIGPVTGGAEGMSLILTGGCGPAGSLLSMIYSVDASHVRGRDDLASRIVAVDVPQNARAWMARQATSTAAAPVENSA